ncbi:hypothetical protein [Aurantibacter sp.]|uniref:hypothetical protein n=1 Tax=Aurantibacter sp. TaxID=2807103 RepID=UPI0035C86D70
MSTILDYITDTLISLDIISSKENLIKKNNTIKRSKQIRLIDLNRQKNKSVK